MIRIGFDLARIKEEYYCKLELDDLTFILTEDDDEGRAELKMRFQTSENCEFIRLLGETDHSLLKYLNNTGCADGIIVESDLSDRSRCNIYIVELKRTVNDQKWTGKVRKQYRGATLRVLSFLSTLGITQVSKIEYITGYVYSSMDQHIDAVKSKRKVAQTSLIGKKTFLGIKDEEVLEWEQDEIRLFQGNFKHRKVQLVLNDQDVGTGAVSIENGTFK
ncbi:hypothetical protein IDH44_07615 [Paenibacillus sp. IB182496]|uniref:Uncharacterized protein n=1 Tax=Paenibacillus sabuli TaxID=2772509 RepID=A0A927GQZ3_9BACL|nr:hypothetical protein [Paenibacillus sabuli]MBD2845054.1 hypothetical protein [Paenibacillus sabuli]